MKINDTVSVRPFAGDGYLGGSPNDILSTLTGVKLFDEIKSGSTDKGVLVIMLSVSSIQIFRLINKKISKS